MNTHLPATHLIAHHLNLALLPRNHTFTPTTLDFNGYPITITRHVEGTTITAIAQCGPIELHCDKIRWSLRKIQEGHAIELLQDSRPVPVLNHFWEVLRTLPQPTEAIP